MLGKAPMTPEQRRAKMAAYRAALDTQVAETKAALAKVNSPSRSDS